MWEAIKRRIINGKQIKGKFLKDSKILREKNVYQHRVWYRQYR